MPADGAPLARTACAWCAAAMTEIGWCAMHVDAVTGREDLERRLARIEGQVRGVRRMLDEGRDCREVVQQLAAVRSAVHQVGLEVVRAYARQCVDRTASEAGAVVPTHEALDDVIAALGRWS